MGPERKCLERLMNLLGGTDEQLEMIKPKERKINRCAKEGFHLKQLGYPCDRLKILSQSMVNNFYRAYAIKLKPFKV